MFYTSEYNIYKGAKLILQIIFYDMQYRYVCPVIKSENKTKTLKIKTMKNITQIKKENKELSNKVNSQIDLANRMLDVQKKMIDENLELTNRIKSFRKTGR